LLNEIKRCIPEGQYWCYPKFNSKSDISIEGEFPDPKEYLIGFVHCERRVVTKSCSPASKSEKRGGQSFLNKMVDDHDKTHGEIKLSKTYKDRDSSEDKMEYDISRLYRKDVLPSNPAKTNFSNYLKFLKTVHKTEKKPIGKLVEEEKNLTMNMRPSRQANPLPQHRKKKVDEAILDYIKERITPNMTINPKLSHKMQ